MFRYIKCFKGTVTICCWATVDLLQLKGDFVKNTWAASRENMFFRYIDSIQLFHACLVNSTIYFTYWILHFKHLAIFCSPLCSAYCLKPLRQSCSWHGLYVNGKVDSGAKLLQTFVFALDGRLTNKSSLCRFWSILKDGLDFSL